jgi:hypothetical protein
MNKPQKFEYPVFYTPYIEILDGVSDLLEHMETSLELFEQLLYELKEEKYEYRYEEGKWTIKEIVQHLIDAERVFVYRSLRFSRRDQTTVMGFEENSYVSNYDINKRDINNLLDEFCLLRRSTILMFQDFDEDTLDLKGSVEGNTFTVRALGFICSGHVLHHLKVIQERYL